MPAVKSISVLFLEASSIYFLLFIFMKPMNPESQKTPSSSSLTPTLISLVLVAVVLGGGYWVYSSGMVHTPMKDNKKMMQPDAPKTEPMMKKDDMMKHDDMMGTGEWTKEEMEAMEKEHMMSGSDMKKDSMMMDDSMMKKDESAMMKPTGYIAYDAAKVSEALKAGQKVVLFFHATWCPSCKALDKAITADTVPADTLIVKVDYDTSEALKKEYRVASQHTTVMLSADGSEKSKKLGARSLAEVLQ
jgi:thiol-disulfide isomerase/thioredoxin